MKKILFFISLTTSFYSVSAQAFKNNENRASFGMGFGWKNKEPYSNSVHFPSVHATVERSVVTLEDVGVLAVGAQFGFHYGFHNGKFPPTGEKYKESWTNVYFIPRVAVYFQELFYEYDFPENIDWYAGTGIGINAMAHKVPQNFDVDDKDGVILGYTFFVGGRYYFNGDMAAFAEFGYGVSYFNLGITLKF